MQAAEKEAREKAAGLRKEIISPGDGKTRPQPGDQLAMHYTGKLAAKWYAHTKAYIAYKEHSSDAWCLSELQCS